MKHQYQLNITLIKYRVSSILYWVSRYKENKWWSSYSNFFIKQGSFGGAFAPKNNKNPNFTLCWQCKLPLLHKILLVWGPQRNYVTGSMPRIIWSHLFTGDNIVHCVWIVCQGQGKAILGCIAKLSTADWL